MSELQIIVTTAGRQALVNAQKTGTTPVLIAQVGLTSQGFAPDAAMTTLPGELKRLSTFAGAVVASDTIHVTIRDDGADVYSLRGFGLYLADGTLFALYGQTGVILEKSSQALMLLAADVRFVQIDATTLTFGDTNWINPPATTLVSGVVELATADEANIGTDAQRAVTPAGIKYALDQRFGAGAPSAFLKDLLTVTTAPLLRTALGIKSAALKDEGAGNALDADMLDGQHGAYYLSWANFTDKPSTFAPSAHTHGDADITALAWSKLSGVPSTFAPSAHTHATLTRGGYLTGGNYDGGTAVTWAVDATTTATASKVVARDSNGDVMARLFRSEFTTTNDSIGYILTQVDTGSNNYIRPSTPAQIKAALAIGMADVASLQSALEAKAALSGAAFTGAITAPTLQATSSDARLKTDIEDLRDCLSTVMRLRPRSWRWKANGESDIGFVAQEHRDVLPQAVHQAERTDGDSEGMLFVRYGKAEPLIVGALHEIVARLNALAARLERIEALT